MANKLLAGLGQAGAITPGSDLVYIEQAGVGKWVTPEELIDDRGMKVYNVLEYGAVAGQDSRAGIQAAIDAAYAAGGGVVYVPPSAGAYLLSYAGTNPYIANHRYALEIKTNVHLMIPSGATLKLADTQMSGSTDGVDLIVGQDVSNIYIGGGGRLTGNTAGQTGWSGGYAQTGHGMGIYLEGTSAGGCLDVIIENLQIDDLFSNGIWVEADAIDRNKRFTLRDLYIHNVGGDSFSICFCEGVTAENIWASDVEDVQTGDGIEFGACTGVTVSNCHIKSNGAGAGIDPFGTHNLTITNCVIDGWYSGISIQAAAVRGRSTIENVVISNCVIRNVEDNGIYIMTGAVNVVIQGCSIENPGANGIIGDASTKVAGPVVICNNTIDGADSSGISINSATRDMSIIGNKIKASASYGITYFWYNSTSADDTDGLLIADNNIADCDYGIVLWGLDDNANNPRGSIRNNVMLNNGTAGFGAAGNTTVAALQIEGNNPDLVSGAAHATVISGYKIYESTGLINITTLLQPSLRQMIIIKFAANATVVDKTESGGDNLSLAGDTNFSAVAGNYLCLQFDGTDWVEMWRKA